jgi:hypothetical protein
MSASDPKIAAMIDDIARATGLSILTVSRALSNMGYVSAQPQAGLGGGQGARLPDEYDGARVQQQSHASLGPDCPISRIVGYFFYFGWVLQGVQQGVSGTGCHMVLFDGQWGDVNCA